jgi:serine palmitoyltransferase
MLTGNLSTTVSSVGGFCCGSKSVIYHQRLNSSGYVYSASLPPLLTCAASAAFKALDKNPALVAGFREKFQTMYQALTKLPGVVVTSTTEATVIHLRLKEPPADRYENEMLLQKIVDGALTNGVLLTRAKYVDSELYMPPPSIRICVCAKVTKDNLNDAISIISKAVASVVSNKPKSE